MATFSDEKMTLQQHEQVNWKFYREKLSIKMKPDPLAKLYPRKYNAFRMIIDTRIADENEMEDNRNVTVIQSEKKPRTGTLLLPTELVPT